MTDDFIMCNLDPNNKWMVNAGIDSLEKAQESARTLNLTDWALVKDNTIVYQVLNGNVIVNGFARKPWWRFFTRLFGR